MCQRLLDSDSIKKKRKCCSPACTKIALSNSGKKGSAKLFNWRKNNPDLYQRALFLAGKSQKGKKSAKPKGLAYLKLHNPEKFLEHQRRAGKHAIKKLDEWRKENPELALKACSEAGKKAHKKYPDLASRMGKSTHRKHPGLASERMKRTNRRLMKEDYNLFIKVRKEGSRKGNETIHKKGFRSKEEKMMRTLLPEDFLWDKNFAGTCPDFRSKSRKVIIEVDGPYHRQPIGNTELARQKFEKCKIRDPRNEGIWRRLGYTFYRFRDDDIRKKFDEIKNKVKSLLENYPLPTNNQPMSTIPPSQESSATHQ